MKFLVAHAGQTMGPKTRPSLGRVKFVLAIIAVCVVLFAIERLYGWPDWLTPDNASGRRLRF